MKHKLLLLTLLLCSPAAMVRDEIADDGDFINVIADIPAAGANGFGRLQA